MVRGAATEAIGTAFLLMAVVGSGIMAERLAAGNVALALLAKAGINVEMINTSEVRVNVAVAGEHGQKALVHLQKMFAENQR